MSNTKLTTAADLRAVRDELDLMVESGLVLPDSYQRFKQLNTELSRLKEKLRADRSA
jgi:Zn-dependent oligopeptidase